MAINLPPPRPRTRVPELRLGADTNILLDGGYSLKYDPSQLRDNQSPYMPNMAFVNGELSKRQGQTYVYPSSLGTGGFNGAFERLYKNQKVFAWGTALYTQSGSSAPVQIMSGLANSKGTFFQFNGILYYLNGTNYVQWNGTTASNVVGYIPTITISRTPTGGGTANEQINLLQPGFKDSFSGNGTATAFQLSQTVLDATAITAVVNGTAINEDAGLTVNRTTGIVTFTSAPSTGTNNVVITAYKTQAVYANRILNCTMAISYGGENDTRMFFAGNPNFSNRLFRSGVADPTYWPDLTFQNVGSDAEAITGLAKHFDKLIVFKERSIFSVVYDNTPYQSMWGSAQTSVSFPTAPLNSAIGCNMPGSIQIIDNNVVFGNTENGLFILVSSATKDERIVRPISGNINGNPIRPGFLNIPKSLLLSASTVDFDGKYILCVGTEAFVWDYKIGPYINTGDMAADEERLKWFYWSNINAACWIQYDQQLFYGDRVTGHLVQFQSNFNDFGASIPAVWKSKVFNFNLPDYLKTITEMWFTTRASSYSNISIRYLSEYGDVIDTASVNTASWSWTRFAWDQFSFAVSQFAPTIKTKPKIKKVIYFQVEFSNNVFNQNLSLLSIIIRYLTVRKVK